MSNEFDEHLYLAANPDVHRAVLAGHITARRHYEEYGAREERPLRPQETRNFQLLRFVERNKPGVEIGPSHNPVAPKALGYNTHVIDHLDRDGLVAKYAAHPERHALIEEVDFVWRGESYVNLTGKRDHYHWIIASHVIEHTPDLIGFLDDCNGILQQNGCLLLAIPSHKSCFDCMRPLSGLAAVVDAFTTKRRRHSYGTAVEYYYNYCTKHSSHVWSGASNQPAHFVYDAADVRSLANNCVVNPDFQDLHSWVFSPESFTHIINSLRHLDFHSFDLEYISEVYDYEFFACLRKGKSGFSPSSWNEERAVKTFFNPIPAT